MQVRCSQHARSHLRHPKEGFSRRHTAKETASPTKSCYRSFPNTSARFQQNPRQLLGLRNLWGIPALNVPNEPLYTGTVDYHLLDLQRDRSVVNVTNEGQPPFECVVVHGHGEINEVMPYAIASTASASCSDAGVTSWKSLGTRSSQRRRFVSSYHGRT